MSDRYQHHMHVKVGPQGLRSRRHFLRTMSAATVAGAAAPWTDVISLRADELRRRGMSCILLWMAGGPSQFETFDPKPGAETGGEIKDIATNVPGIRIAENLPRLARLADELAIVRSMSTKEGEHQRASYLMHTSYIPTATVRYPTLGAVVAKELADAASELPSFVRIGNRGPGVATDGGLLGSKYDSFAVQSATRPPENTRPATESDRYQARLALLDRLEAAAPTSASAAQVRDHSTLYETTSRMVLSPSMQAFDISREPESVRAAYGLTASANEPSIRPNGGPRTAPRGEFAAGCLMARRLVEAGVTFVEVGLGGWDTHQDNFDAVKRLCESMDQPYAALIEDLRQRGMLDNTLVIWMGEFGRTPRINPRGGRDHYPRAFSAVLAGAGIQVGQVYGETDAGGYAVTDSPVSEKDLFQTVYKALKIDAHKENMSPIGRPIRIVEGGQAVTGLLA